MADVLVVGLLLYRIYQFAGERVAVGISAGCLLLHLTYLVAEQAEMRLLTTILRQLAKVGLLALIILFQQEIRRFLFAIWGTTTLGKDKLLRRLLGNKRGKKLEMDITPTVEAVKTLAGSNTGAIIVFSSSGRGLKFYEDSGEPIGALVSKRLLLAIFNKQSPLHDGGVIIYHNRIVTARSILPITERRGLPAHFGLRHRAAIGITEITDTLALVVSEETGQVSVARNGSLEHNLSIQEMRTVINDYLQDRHPDLNT